MINYYLDALKKYAVFSGRARRSEYWYFNLVVFLVCMFFSVASEFIGGKASGIFYGLSTLFSFAMMVPSYAVLVRRLHDIGRSGWMFFIVFIPFVGFIWLIILLATDSTPGENKYGPNPKGIAAK